MKRFLLSSLLCTLLAAYGISARAQTTPAADSTAINRFPSIPFLPDPLLLDEGGRNIPVATSAQWQQKREWIKQQYQRWVSGSVPPPPGKIHSKVLSDSLAGGVRFRMVELAFGPEDKAKMRVELMIPEGKKRLPVFMTQWNHRGWAQIAVRRGYIGCVYAGADGNDDTRNYGEIFPGYDFATLMKRAWGGSRVVDYLVTLPEVDTARIALTGHSRNGKQSLMAAAFDTRIKAVVSSSGGTGAESTFRFSDERFNSESVEEITRNFPTWFVSRLRWFTGREQKLPVDQNELMSLIAPRGLMMVSAITEGQGNPWGIEQSYRSVGKTYHFLHADSSIAILLRQGRHQHAARDVEDFIDFFDYIFGRSGIAPENKRYSGYTFEKWKQQSGENVNALQFPVAAGRAPLKADSLQLKLRWLLGEEPPGTQTRRPFSSAINGNRAYPNDYLADVIEEPKFPASVTRMEIGPYTPLGENLWGTMYFPSSAIVHDSVSKKLPLVIFLHEYAYATGYHRRNVPVIRQLTDQGFAVLCFDLVGFGTRIEEARHFYDRFPHWSLMGKMVADTRNVVEDAYTRMPFIDSGRIYLAGYSLGGTVSLLTAALTPHVKGVAVASAFGSLRHNDATTEGNQHFYRLHGLLPRLGFFEGHEDRIPVDFEEILAGVSPRNVLVIAPERDRTYPVPVVQQTISAAGGLQSPWLSFQHPDTYNNFPESLQQQLAAWLKEKASAPAVKGEKGF